MGLKWTWATAAVRPGNMQPRGYYIWSWLAESVHYLCFIIINSSHGHGAAHHSLLSRVVITISGT